MSTCCQMCRLVDKWNGRFCLSLNSGSAVQYKLHAQFLRLFSLHDDVNDAHRAGANRLQNNKLEMQDGHLAETQQSLRPIRSEQQQRQRQDQQFEEGENFDYYADQKVDGGTTELLRNPPAASSSSTSH